jgi:uncharacterized membrane protein YozB (DUF420 family)
MVPEKQIDLAVGLVSFGAIIALGFLLLGRSAPAQEAGRFTILPSINALLNGASALLLTAGFLFIRRGRPRAHRTCMLTAFAVSCLFLVSYIIYHQKVGSIPFRGTGWIRLVYYPLLVSHILLATTIVPLALTALARALMKRWKRHRMIARVALPIWLFVSVSGVLVYLILYHYPVG